MNHILRIMLLCVLLVAALPTHAQEPELHEKNNLHSIAQDLKQIGLAEGVSYKQDTLPPAPVPERKTNFIRRIIDYYSRSNVDRTFEKKIDWSIAPGPSYSSDVGFGLGFLLAGLYRIDRTDSVTSPSNISIYGDITTKKFIMLRFTGENVFNRNLQRVNYSGAFVHFPGEFYGVGYKDGKAGYKQALTTTIGSMRVASGTAIWSWLYLGIGGGIDYSGAKFSSSGMTEKIREVEAEVEAGGAIPEGQLGQLYELWTQGKYDPALQDPFSNYINATGEDPDAFNAHLGIFAQYDTRDVTFNAYKGIFLKLEAKWYPKFFGNTGRNFGRLTCTFDWYQRLWKGAVLAYDLYGDFLLGTPSWHLYAKMGGSDRMRGYYEGRYRDKRLIETQLELRQKIYRRHGIVGWVGLGNIWGRDNFRWKNTLYNFGVGYRFEFKKRMNIRLDYGWGEFGNRNLPWDNKRSSAFFFTVSEAF